MAQQRQWFSALQFVIHYLSQFMVLEPGDLINTGTPPGVGLGMKPPMYLEAGDLVRLGASQLGSQEQRVISYDAVVEAAAP